MVQVGGGDQGQTKVQVGGGYQGADQGPGGRRPRADQGPAGRRRPRGRPRSRWEKETTGQTKVQMGGGDHGADQGQGLFMFLLLGAQNREDHAQILR
ncbi:hypothetical protein NHX12_025120 [Muraenolepis orangiensis]|uniref:Uncharacterized protein n=1 Tax=Muraenolepis orangiensis TaxID=630683 RepID=A0A9Q0EIP9_9TELE|nr:hypothetical protein NHX12_025120 [Muraenolepis orangiensis]